MLKETEKGTHTFCE